MQRKHLLAAASVITLATGLAAPSAQAFDRVWWDWNLDVDTKVDVRVDVDINVDPKGAVISETDQYFKGSQEATAKIGDVYVDPKGYHLDGATDLGEVNNVAAALGNSNAITSDFSVQSDVDQDAIGTAWYGADFEATAKVYDIDNASVSNVAQAIANSNSITVDPLREHGWYHSSSDDALIISNVEQSAYANGSAYASVYDVTIRGFGDLGSGDNELNRALVTNSAIAAGNVNNITLVNGAIAFPDQDN
ncbi:MAG: hypothetical protein R3F55_03565 [Alphaproteobacteria bacterium]